MDNDIKPVAKIIEDMLDDIECDIPEFEYVMTNKLLYCIKKGGILGRKLMVGLLLYILEEDVIEKEAEERNEDLTLESFKDHLVDIFITYCESICKEDEEKIEKVYEDMMGALFEKDDIDARIISSSSKNKNLN